MNDERSTPATAVPSWLVLVISLAALVIATAALTATLVGRPIPLASGAGRMGGGAMMGGYRAGSGAGATNGPQPGEPGFVAGTPDAPRVVRVLAGPGPGFRPSAISVVRGETVTFEVTTMGPIAHEFMVGPAAAVAADVEGTPEISDIGMMATKSLTVAFDGPGPYAFACHVEGHYEAGMRGSISLVG